MSSLLVALIVSVWYVLGAIGAYWILRMQDFSKGESAVGAAFWFFALPFLGLANLAADVALMLRRER